MKNIVERLERLKESLDDCEGVGGIAYNLEDTIDELQILCGMRRERCIPGYLTARDARWCVVARIHADGMLEVFADSEAGEEKLPMCFVDENMPMRDVVSLVTKKMNELY